MNIRKPFAEQMIFRISNVFDYSISIMNKNGRTLASTNPSKIDTFNEAALLIAEQNLDILIAYDEHTYKGCGVGAFMPIIIDNDMVCVVGINGSSDNLDEIMKYSKIIQEIGKLLVKEMLFSISSNLREQEKTLFLSEWINGIALYSEADFFRRMKEFSFTLHGGITVSILNIYRIGFEKNMFYDIQDRLTQMGLMVIPTDNHFVIIISSSTEKEAYAKASTLIQRLHLTEGSYLYALGNFYDDYFKAHLSYQEARKVFRQRQIISQGIFTFPDEILNVFLNEAPDTYKEKYINSIFKNCNSKEILDFCEFISIYCKHNGSIISIANELFLHKNTVQYRIDKLYKKTGLNLRDVNDAILLKISTIWANYAQTL